MSRYYVYILANKRWTLYTGVTNDLMRRVDEHKHRLADGFNRKYGITDLVHYESTADVKSAIAREKQIKGWLRRKKITLIQSANPQRNDLAEGWYEDQLSPSDSSP